MNLEALSGPLNTLVVSLGWAGGIIMLVVLVMFIQDITQRKMATEMLTRNKQELEDLVKIRTQHLQQTNENLITEIAESVCAP